MEEKKFWTQVKGRLRGLSQKTLKAEIPRKRAGNGTPKSENRKGGQSFTIRGCPRDKKPMTPSSTLGGGEIGFL